jgi:hypothetical protein
MRSIFRNIFQIAFLVAGIIQGTGLTAQHQGFFNYQAVVTDTDGTPYQGTVGIRISILQPGADGDVVYSERHTKETDHGFVSFRVGEGEQVYTGEFDTINWSAGPSFIRTEIAPGGGYSYALSSTTELASVPMAMYAMRAESVSSDFVEADPLFAASVASLITAEDTLRWNRLSTKSMYQVGDLHAGGIIFYLEPGGEHGLVVSLADIAEDVVWAGADVVSGASNSYDGAQNTAVIVAAQAAGNYAAYYCDTLVLNGYDDWYLPAPDEMYLLFRAGYALNSILEQDGDEQTEGITAGQYWTSKEKNASEAFIFMDGHLGLSAKNGFANVRAIRAF